MIKLVASDIDGTLVPEGTTSIDPEFYEIIRKLKKESFLQEPAAGSTAVCGHFWIRFLTISFSFPETEPISCGRAKNSTPWE